MGGETWRDQSRWKTTCGDQRNDVRLVHGYSVSSRRDSSSPVVTLLASSLMHLAGAGSAREAPRPLSLTTTPPRGSTSGGLRTSYAIIVCVPMSRTRVRVPMARNAAGVRARVRGISSASGVGVRRYARLGSGCGLVRRKERWTRVSRELRATCAPTACAHAPCITPIVMTRNPRGLAGERSEKNVVFDLHHRLFGSWRVPLFGS